MPAVRRFEAGDAPAVAAIIRGLPGYFTDDVPAKVERDAASNEAWVITDSGTVAGFALAAKTLDSSSGYRPYEATRAFWERDGYVQVDTIDPLPGWQSRQPSGNVPSRAPPDPVTSSLNLPPRGRGPAHRCSIEAQRAGRCRDGAVGMTKFDTSRPNIARIYDYLLGGKDHFAADRQAAQQLVTALPNAAAVARANRTFLAAAVRHVAREGIAQYLDIGAGLPTPPSVHECARAMVPGARVAYVDNDPVAVSHAQALLATGDGVIATEGDARDPEAILAHPALAGVIDLTEPVCVLLVSMLHFFTAEEADMIVGTFRQRMVPGSYLIISQGVASGGPSEGVQNAYGRDITLTGRPDTEIAAYFDGFDLVPPGLVPVAEWPADQPDARLPAPEPLSRQASMLAGVGRKRT